MTSDAKTPNEYIASLPDDRKAAIGKLREVILANLPDGFEETMSYGMIGYVVPHSIYPAGYHVDPKLPLPFMNLASQKNNVAIYHSGIYANPDLADWFKKEYGERVSTKLNMGKSCVRIKKMEHIPYDLIGELAAKMTVNDWIELYEKNVKR